MSPSVNSEPSQCETQSVGSGVSTLWQEVIARLEASVEQDICSDDPTLVLKSIRILRQFVVASVMNKSVVGNSMILRPRLLNSLGRLNKWSHTNANLCTNLFGLINSLVRDCNSFADHILDHLELLEQLFELILDKKTDSMVREADLLFLRSLFKASDLGSVLHKSSKQEKIAIKLFTEIRLEKLIDSLVHNLHGNDQTKSDLYETDFVQLTSNARCWLIELLALISTNSNLAERLASVNALKFVHQTIMFISCRHHNYNKKNLCSRVGCQRTIDPNNHLAARFALKLMVHLFFHLPSSLESFQKICGEVEPIKLVACYSHLTGTMPPSLPNVCYSTPHNPRNKRILSPTKNYSIEKNYELKQYTPPIPKADTPQTSLTCPITSQLPISTCSCVPLDYATYGLTGLVRGLIYWRLANQRNSKQSVEAVDQFGAFVTHSVGLGITDDDVALLIIQPLTESCLHLEATRLMTWACHVLMLVLDKRPELHLWTVYTNSFVREVDSRVTSLLKAVQESTDSHNQIQFLEHLIPLVKLFACLASGHESTRVLIGELTMCKGLIEFAIRLKTLGSENENVLIEFQHSISLLLHILSRSFTLHHTFFRQQSTGNYLVKLIEDNVSKLNTDESELHTSLVESASSALVNLVLPMCPLKEPLLENFIQIFLRILNITTPELNLNSINQSNSINTKDVTYNNNTTTVTPTINSITTTTTTTTDNNNFKKYESLTLLHLNGIWGLTNLLHESNSTICLNVYNELIKEGLWLELLQLATSISNIEFNSNISLTNDWLTNHDYSFDAKPKLSVSNNFSNEQELNSNPIRSSGDSNSDILESDPTVTGKPMEQSNFISNLGDDKIDSKEDTKTSDYSTMATSTSSDNIATALTSSLTTNISKVSMCNSSNNTNNDFTPCAIKIETKSPSAQSTNDSKTHHSILNSHQKSVLSKRETYIRILIVYHSLSFLRNLLRDEQVIDSIVKEHWWNITQLIISVLESNYPQPVKEQAILVLAHIATGRFARCEVHRNGDLVEKLTLFMRSQNSYTKAAALTATYNLLGLQTDCLDSCGLLRAFGCRHKPFLLSHNRSSRTQHHRHSSDHRTKPELTKQSNSLISSGMNRREVTTCMAQSALEEAEEENDDEEQDTVVEHISSIELVRSQHEQPLPEVSESSVSAFIDSRDQPRLRTLRRRRYYRSWQQSPSNATSENQDLLEHSEQEPQINLSRSLSLYSTSSTSSTSSCAEGEGNVTAELACLQQTTAIEICDLSSPSCSDDDIQDSNRNPKASPNSPSERAPLADEEREDDDNMLETEPASTQSQLSGQTGSSNDKFDFVFNVDNLTADQNIEASVTVETTNLLDNGSETNINLSSTIGNPTCSTSATNANGLSSRNSQQNWETGFSQILLPFLKELDSDPVIRSTWDWLMLRASTDGKPVFLNTLFHAWQRLYTNIPNLSSLQSKTDYSTASNSQSTHALNTGDNSNNITMDEFLTKIRESIDPDFTFSVFSSFPRHLDHSANRLSHRCRRQHRHHCQHRHHLRRHHHHRPTTERPESPTTVDRLNLTDSPLPPTTSPDNLDPTD